MNVFGIQASAEAAEFIREVESAMERLYSVPRLEAIGRIRYFWSRTNFLSQEATLLVQHQTPEHWAAQIYYGHKGDLPDDGPLRPVPYPPE